MELLDNILQRILLGLQVAKLLLLRLKNLLLDLLPKISSTKKLLLLGKVLLSLFQLGLGTRNFGIGIDAALDKEIYVAVLAEGVGSASVRSSIRSTENLDGRDTLDERVDTDNLIGAGGLEVIGEGVDVN